MGYTAPTWINGKPPAINAERLNDLCSTVQTLDEAMPTKQDKLTFDNVPTSGSSNPVKSSGIKTALDGKAAASHTHAMSDVIGLTTAIQYGPAGIVGFQGSEDFPLASCVAEITPVQAGSGDPSPSNVRPISRRENIKVWRFGKNFFPQADVKLRTNEGNKNVNFPHPLPAGTYTFSADLTSTFDGNCIIHIIRGDGTSIQLSWPPGSRVSASFTSAEGNEIIGIRFYIGDGYNTSYNNSGAWSNIQVETGSTATAYEVSETVIDADLPELVYGGTLDVLKGTLTVDRAFATFTWGSLTGATVLGNYTRKQSSGALTPTPKGAEGSDICNVAPYNLNWSAQSTHFYIDASTKRLVLTLPTATADSTAIQVCYKLAETPVTYQLTPQLVAAVAGANHIWADTGNVTVAYGAFPGALQRELPRAFETYYITTGREEGTALGDAATAEGRVTVASGDTSHAEGMATQATGWGYGAHAEGLNTRAHGYFTHAEGVNTFANSEEPGVSSIVDLGGAHAEGFGTIAGGEQSHAEGKNTRSAGIAAHAEGRESSAGGDYSHAEGRNTDAVGDESHAEGYYCQAFKAGSHAEGNHTIADGSYQHVFGQYNVSDTTSVEIVGWGTSSTRKNIRTLDNSGNMTIAGTLTQSSDAQLKTVKGEIPDVSEIHAVRFRWNDVNGQHDDIDHVGYIAQDVEKVAPFMVKNDSNGYKALDYIAFLCAKMELLERRVKELEEKKE